MDQGCARRRLCIAHPSSLSRQRLCRVGFAVHACVQGHLSAFGPRHDLGPRAPLDTRVVLQRAVHRAQLSAPGVCVWRSPVGSERAAYARCAKGSVNGVWFAIRGTARHRVASRNRHGARPVRRGRVRAALEVRGAVWELCAPVMKPVLLLVPALPTSHGWAEGKGLTSACERVRLCVEGCMFHVKHRRGVRHGRLWCCCGIRAVAKLSVLHCVTR